MIQDEVNNIIARKLSEGLTLGEVQKVLLDEYGVNMTYLDLRLIASELDVDWKSCTPAKPVTSVTPETASLTPESGTKVELSKIARPGAALSGSVSFASGASAEWLVDNMGRLKLIPAAGSGKPTEDDLIEFQQELQRIVSGQG